MAQARSRNGSVPGHGREYTVFERRKNRSSGTGGQLAVNMRVRVYAGTDAESRGVVVEDFGELAGHAVDIGGHRIADPSRRWAVQLDTGNLVFADSDQLVAE
jgi:hypothetical protein